MILMENGIWEFVNTKFTPPTDVVALAIYIQMDRKARRIILDVVM